MEWISVEERLPEFNTHVVGLCFLGPMIFEYAKPGKDFEDIIPDPYWALINFDGSDGLDTFVEIEPTHWMPLPPPPEGKD